DLRLRVVAVPALVVAERPERRQRRASGERGVALDHLLRRRTVDEVVVELSRGYAEGEELLRLGADVDRRPERVVEEDAVGAALPQHHDEGDRDVDGVGAGVVARRVAVPHRVRVAAEPLPALVEPTHLLAEAVDILVLAQALPDLHARTRDGGAEIGVVLVERLPARGR